MAGPAVIGVLHEPRFSLLIKDYYLRKLRASAQELVKLLRSRATKKTRLFVEGADEGCISHAGQLDGCSCSEPMIDDLVKMHQSFGIKSKKYVAGRREYSPLFRIHVSKCKENFARFIDKIGFQYAIVTKGYHIGKAKKDLLLEKFIEAYPN